MEPATEREFRMKWSVAILMLLTSSLVFAAEDLQIVDVRRNIPLSDDEPVYKDFYISVGESTGLKKNLVVTAMRRWPVRDAIGAQTIGEIEAPVGQLKIIAVFGKIAVAREFQLIDRDEEPMLEQIGIMIGDRVELKGSFVDKNKPKKKTAAVEPVATPPAEATPVPVAAPTGEVATASAPLPQETTASAMSPAITPAAAAIPPQALIPPPTAAAPTY